MKKNRITDTSAFNENIKRNSLKAMSEEELQRESMRLDARYDCEHAIFILLLTGTGLLLLILGFISSYYIGLLETDSTKIVRSEVDFAIGGIFFILFLFFTFLSQRKLKNIKKDLDMVSMVSMKSKEEVNSYKNNL